MIPRERPAPAKEQEKVPVEMEEIQVTDYDFYFQGHQPLMVTILPEDILRSEVGRTVIVAASGEETEVREEKLVYTVRRQRTVKRPKKA